VWDSMGRCLEQCAPAVCFKLTSEQIQNPDNLVKYLKKVCCHPGNSRETQITTMCWGQAHAYRALFNTVQCLKGERGRSETAGTATGDDPQTALQPLQPRRQSQIPRPAQRLPMPQLQGLPRFPWRAQQLPQPQVQLQAQ